MIRRLDSIRSVSLDCQRDSCPKRRVIPPNARDASSSEDSESIENRATGTDLVAVRQSSQPHLLRRRRPCCHPHQCHSIRNAFHPNRNGFHPNLNPLGTTVPDMGDNCPQVRPGCPRLHPDCPETAPCCSDFHPKDSICKNVHPNECPHCPESRDNRSQTYPSCSRTDFSCPEVRPGCPRLWSNRPRVHPNCPRRRGIVFGSSAAVRDSIPIAPRPFPIVPTAVPIVPDGGQMKRIPRDICASKSLRFLAGRVSRQ